MTFLRQQIEDHQLGLHTYWKIAHKRKWKVKVKIAQSCPTLCDPVDYTVCGLLQARILEWVAFPFSRGSSQPRDGTQVFRTAGRFFTSWATREAQKKVEMSLEEKTDCSFWVRKTHKIYEFYIKHIYWALDNHWIVLTVVESQRTRNSSMLVKLYSHI